MSMAMQRVSCQALLLAFVLCTARLAWAVGDCFPEEVISENAFPAVVIETSLGEFTIELNRLRAPVAANNFLHYVLAGHYDGTLFHRVMPGFVVQGGGYTETFEERPVRAPIINESGNGLQNSPMSVAMARYDDPHSATSQFYINLAANTSLDPGSKNWGYAVFAQVIAGQEVIEAIASVPTHYEPGLDAENVPVQAVKIIRAYVAE